MKTNNKVADLVKRGATIYSPESVFIDPELNLDLISPDITIYPSCRILGKYTSIGPACIVGKEGSVTIEDCQLADKVSLNGGFYSGSTFLSGVVCGSCAHVRPATLMEEQSSFAHSVGLKQTLLFPFATLGSLINFCDCLLAGGTNRKNHSEVGSSYIHFNYTPHQDKATPSLIGDVPRGVMLDQPPIFLGGQGGLVGPSVIEYGAITAAGTICRKDISEPGKLVYENALPRRIELPYQPGAYADISRVINNNMIYIGNIIALLQWYNDVRSLFLSSPFATACHKGATEKIHTMIEERLVRMKQLADNMPRSLEIAQNKLGAEPIEEPFATQKQFADLWPGISDQIKSTDFSKSSPEKDKFLNHISKNSSSSPYIETIKDIPANIKSQGTAWLQNIVKTVTSIWLD